jgi:hypothetical protein
MYWHYHKEEFALNRADPKLPILSEQQQNATLKKLEESFGKVIITSNPNDKAQYSHHRKYKYSTHSWSILRKSRNREHMQGRSIRH